MRQIFRSEMPSLHKIAAFGCEYNISNILIRTLHRDISGGNKLILLHPVYKIILKVFTIIHKCNLLLHNNSSKKMRQ